MAVSEQDQLHGQVDDAREGETELQPHSVGAALSGIAPATESPNRHQGEIGYDRLRAATHHGEPCSRSPGGLQSHE